jgi:hypothetical protein
MRVRIVKWLRAHWKPLLVHTFVLSGFLFFCIFLSDSLFARFETIDGESKLQDISLPAETGGISLQIDRVEAGAYITEVWGWALIDGQSSENSEVYIVLKSDDKCYVFDTMKQTKAYSGPVVVSYSGFVCNIPSTKISSGQHVIGIFITSGDIQALQYTDRVLVKSDSGFTP